MAISKEAQNLELDRHWREVFETGKASDTLVCLEARMQRAAQDFEDAMAELRDWARQDIANARQHGRP